MEHCISINELFEKQEDSLFVITKERSTGRILGLSLINEEAFRKTIKTGKSHYWDDVNKAVYLKGEHSREIESVLDIRLDICHARRHQLHLLFEVEMEEGECKFGMNDCHFYKFEDGCFRLDSDCIIDENKAQEFEKRIKTFLTREEDRRHMQRFSKM